MLRLDVMLAQQAEFDLGARLRIGGEEIVYAIERLRQVDDRPVILERRYVVARFCPELSERGLSGSLYAAWTERYRLDIVGAEQTIRAVSIEGDDAELLGVADVAGDYRVRAAVRRGLAVYAAVPERAEAMAEAGVPVAGGLDDLLAGVDVVVDCAPKGIGARNLARYREAGGRAVVQGGEDHALTGHSFVAQANYVGDGIVALNSTVELRKDLGRPRGDMGEVVLWSDILIVQGAEAYYTYQVYNEAIVVPENVDAIRALCGTVRDGAASVAMTDEALGMRKEFLG